MFIVVCEIHGEIFSTSDRSEARRVADQHVVEPGHYLKWVRVINRSLLRPPTSTPKTLDQIEEMEKEATIYTVIGSTKD